MTDTVRRVTPRSDAARHEAARRDAARHEGGRPEGVRRPATPRRDVAQPALPASGLPPSTLPASALSAPNPPSIAAAEPPVWIVAAQADACSAEDRAAFGERAAERMGNRGDRLLLVTCHRAELFGAGELPGPDEMSALAGADHLAARFRILVGTAAARHAFRLAAGLESAVVGEDQVLHQVRELRDDARERGPLDPHLARMFEVALGVGRRARAARHGWAEAGRAGATIAGGDETAPGADASRSDRGEEAVDDSLAVRALDWLADRGAALPGTTLLVVGAGEMATLVALEGRRRRLDIVVASRNRARAEATARRAGGRGIDLAASGNIATSASAVAVALSGPWLEAPSGRLLPPTVDLSSPAALPPGRAVDQLDIDGLFRWAERASTRPASRRYERSAEPLIEEAVHRYARWSAGRSSVEALRRVREAAEASRRDELERLLRRLPGLEPRERALVEAFSQQLVATLLHGPTVRLREDRDGSAADAARRLFGL